MTIESSVLVLNPHVPFVQAAKLQRTKVDVPDHVRNLPQPDVFEVMGEEAPREAED